MREFVDSCVPGPPEPKRALIRKIELAICQFEKDSERPTVNTLRSFIQKLSMEWWNGVSS
ncbi:MAG: hypothetical protein ACREOB_09925 [Thermodesulfobacteriota bacterium]